MTPEKKARLLAKAKKYHEHIKENEKLIEAALHGELETLKKCLARGAEMHAKNDYALRLAARMGHLPVVEFLVENDADVHEYDDWALRHAASNGHLPVVKFLVENGADIHARRNQAFEEAERQGHTGVVKYLEAKIKKEEKEEMSDEDLKFAPGKYLEFCGEWQALPTCHFQTMVALNSFVEDLDIRRRGAINSLFDYLEDCTGIRPPPAITMHGMGILRFERCFFWKTPNDFLDPDCINLVYKNEAMEVDRPLRQFKEKKDD